MPPVHSAYDNATMANLVDIKMWKKDFEYELYMNTPVIQMIDMESRASLPFGNELVFTVAARPKLGNSTKLACGDEYVCKTRPFEQCSIKIDCWRTHSFGVCKQTEWQSMVNLRDYGKKTVLEEIRMDISYDILRVLKEGVEGCTPDPSSCEPAPASGDHLLDQVSGVTIDSINDAIAVLAAQGVPFGSGDVYALADLKLATALQTNLEGQCTMFCKPGSTEYQDVLRQPLPNSSNIMMPIAVLRGAKLYALEFAGQDPENLLSDGAGVHYLYIFHKSAVKALFQKEVAIEGPFKDAKATDYVWNVDALYGLKFYSCNRAVILPVQLV